MVLADLTIAVAAFKLDWPDAPIYLLLALTIAASIASAIFYMGSVRGVRSAEALGFNRLRDAYVYQLSGSATSKPVIALLAAASIVWAYAGGSTAPALLALFNIPLIGIYRSVTAKYPADDQ